MLPYSSGPVATSRPHPPPGHPWGWPLRASGRLCEQFGLISCTSFTMLTSAGAKPVTPEENIMSWNKPKVVEVSLALEINSYVSAEIA